MDHVKQYYVVVAEKNSLQAKQNPQVFYKPQPCLHSHWIYQKSLNVTEVDSTHEVRLWNVIFLCTYAILGHPLVILTSPDTWDRHHEI